MGNNAVVKHMKMFRKILNICLNNNWIQTDPYANFKGKYKKVDKAILTQQEIELIGSKEFVSERLSQVRDTFLFCCYTGLAYSDVQKLKTSDISVGFDGEHWLIWYFGEVDHLIPWQIGSSPLLVVTPNLTVTSFSTTENRRDHTFAFSKF